ncbi:MAG: MoxR family ATPase [Pseudomonadota bacterium]|nr:MoxR family ATPase [Pseudomonadota bacterium]
MSSETNKKDTPDQNLSDTAAKLRAARAEVGKIIFGQDDVIDQIFTTLLCGGHGLLIGVPGLAKTLMVDTIAKAFGLDAGRIQCTPDLMPADILGSEVLEEAAGGKRSFRYIKGPIFKQFLMADEINRASPRTQSALLQAMQEKTVTVSGQEHKLPEPFHVLATQNPIEQEGTYPLPEAQLDRFMMQIDVDYPDLEAERAIVIATTTGKQPEIKSALSKGELVSMQSLVRDMPIGESVIDAILTTVRSLRPGTDAGNDINEYVTWPPGPRASQSLMLAVRARALLEGRSAPSVDDVKALAEPILKHRMALNYQARADGVTVETLITRVTDTL